jgi:hypothetical protein
VSTGQPRQPGTDLVNRCPALPGRCKHGHLCFVDCRLGVSTKSSRSKTRFLPCSCSTISFNPTASQDRCDPPSPIRIAPDCNTPLPFRLMRLHHGQTARRVEIFDDTRGGVRPAIMPALRHCGSHVSTKLHVWLNRVNGKLVMLAVSACS